MSQQANDGIVAAGNGRRLKERLARTSHLNHSTQRAKQRAPRAGVCEEEGACQNLNRIGLLEHQTRTPRPWGRGHVPHCAFGQQVEAGDALLNRHGANGCIEVRCRPLKEPALGLFRKL